MEEIIKDLEEQIKECEETGFENGVLITKTQAKQIVEALKRADKIESRFDGRFG